MLGGPRRWEVVVVVVVVVAVAVVVVVVCVCVCVCTRFDHLKLFPRPVPRCKPGAAIPSVKAE